MMRLVLVGLALAGQPALPIHGTPSKVANSVAPALSAVDSVSVAPPPPPPPPSPPLLEVAVDWPTFLARSDMEWAWNTTVAGGGLVPVDWWNSAFLGNGNLGLQVVAGLHQGDRLAPPKPPAPPPASERCCCCWNRDTQPCNTTSQCDTGGEGCLADGASTKKYGPVTCTCDGKSHGCPPLPLSPPSPPVPPLAAQPALRFEVGRLDVTDDRLPGSPHYTGNLKCDRPRLAIGYLYLRAKGKVQTGAMRLSLWNAELLAAITTDAGMLNASIFTHATSDVNVIHVVPSGGEVGRGCDGIEWTPIQGDALSGTVTSNPHRSLIFIVQGQTSEIACEHSLADGGPEGPLPYEPQDEHHGPRLRAHAERAAAALGQRLRLCRAARCQRGRQLYNLPVDDGPATRRCICRCCTGCRRCRVNRGSHSAASVPPAVVA